TGCSVIPNDISTGDPACDSCLAAECCGQFTACLSDPYCSQCFSPNAPASCDTDPLYAASIGCSETDCGPVRGAGSSTICDPGLSTGDPTCDQCLGDLCCDAFDACLGDPNCSACLTSGGAAPACDVNSLFQTANDCYAQQCGTTCGYYPICTSGW